MTAKSDAESNGTHESVSNHAQPILGSLAPGEEAPHPPVLSADEGRRLSQNADARHFGLNRLSGTRRLDSGRNMQLQLF